MTAPTTRFALFAAGLLLVACQGDLSSEPPVHLNQNMDQQNRHEAQEETSVFDDGRAMRNHLEGTVPVGHLREDPRIYAGKNAQGDFLKALPPEAPKGEKLELTKELLERALSIQEREYGPEHVEVAATLGNLGNAFGDLGDYQKAKELLERAYKITKKEFGSGHTRFAHVCIGLAKAHGGLKDGVRQQEYAQVAYDIYKSSMGPTHLLVADALLELGNAQVQLENASEAVSMLNLSHTIFERELGMESAGAAKAMRSLGVAKGSLGEVDSAVALLEGACKIFKRKFGPSHVQVETTTSALLQLTTALPEDRPKKKPRLE